MAIEADVAVETVDLQTTPRRELNARLHALAAMDQPEPAKVYVWERERV